MRGKANLKMYLLNITILLILITSSYAHDPMPPTGPPKIIYVDDDFSCACDGDGLSWSSAFKYLQDALEIAQDGDEIRVAQGVYKPDQGAFVTEGDQREYFHITNGITLKGGYAGVGESDPNVRDIDLYKTVLSGDLNSDDVYISDPGISLDSQKFEENSYDVVRIEETDATVIFDGFVVTAGHGATSGRTGYSPGGFGISSGSPIISNCVFTHNVSSAVHVFSDSSPTFIDCKFTENRTSDDGGGLVGSSKNGIELVRCEFIDNFAEGKGGGLHIGSDSYLSMVDCTFSGNIASRGGALYGDVDIIDNCVFTGNSAVFGGALYGIGRNAEEIVIEKCIFTGNRAEDGAVLIGIGSVSLTNCTLADNLAYNGYIIDAGSFGHSAPYLEINVINCILRDGDNEFSEFHGNIISISNSNIRGGWPSGENIDEDPLFANPGYWVDADDLNIIAESNDPNAVWIDGDYHLKSQAGRYDPSNQNWVIDEISSLCIDAGDPNTFVDDEPFPNGGIINMGAYGGTVQASKSPSGVHFKYGGGIGEPNDPYLIYTAGQMNSIGTAPDDRNKHFKLMADIDLSVYKKTEFNIIELFTGVFDGNGHTISNFSYTSSDRSSTGLFSHLSYHIYGQDPQIKNLGLIAPAINAGSGGSVGSLVGHVSFGIITNCYAEGGRVSGDDHVGGLVGVNLFGNINDCYSTCNVSGEDVVGGLVGVNEFDTTIKNCSSGGEVFGRSHVGGLAGRNNGTIENSSASGSVTGENRDIGGFVGYNSGPLISCSAEGDVSGNVQVGGLVGDSRSFDSISNCYATGDVFGIEFVGGLVGHSHVSISNCYATGSVSGTTYIGGLVGYKEDDVTVLASFWDIEASGQTTSAGGIGKTTAEMQSAHTFLNAGWDFVDETENGTEDIWSIFEGQDYPRLWWEHPEDN